MTVRYTQVNNIEVGYDYPKKKYYVTNLTGNTTTYRDTIEAIQDVLQALEITSVTDEQLQGFKDNYETINDNLDNTIYYTWEDTGLYIKSLQFNRWKDYPLIIDCEKAKLYIKNSTTIFDLNSKESIRIIVAPILCSFYKEILGINISTVLMTGLCNFLLYFYHPTCVNLIGRVQGDNTRTLRYTNIYKLTNYDKTSPATYTCTNNPLETYTYSNIGNIIKANDNTISLLEPIDMQVVGKYNVKEGATIRIEGIKEQIEDTVYTADGDYTIESVSDDLKTITIAETLPLTYTYNFYNCYVQDASCNIVSINREDSSITVDNMPDSILIGDKIIVTGCTIHEQYEDISLNGEYTVQSISDNTIIVEEQLATNYTGIETSKLYKSLYISPISYLSEDKTTITLLEPTEINLNNSRIMCYNSSIQNIDSYIVVNTIPDEKGKIKQLVVSEAITDLNFNYPKLQLPVPSPVTMISVEESSNTKVLPTGDYMVDNYTEVNNYLTLLKDKNSNFLIPDDMNNESDMYKRGIEDYMYSEVQGSIEIHVIFEGQDFRVTNTELQGLYSEVYTEE